jgi:uncharacterized protein GlcG (DUF336 family)
VLPVISSPTIGFEGARSVYSAAVDAASGLHLAICVAVVDRAGHLVLYGRMDGAPLVSASLAQDKAWTAVAFGVETHLLWEQIHEAPALVHGLPKNDRVMVIGGGAPITADGQVVGAVGISGGTPAQDQQLARTAADALS